MWRNCLVLSGAMLVLVSFEMLGQTKKRFTVESEESFDKVAFNLYSPSGTCQIRPTQHPNLLTVYCKSQDENYSPSFNTQSRAKTKVISLNLKETHAAGIGDAISRSVFNSTGGELENKCNIYLSHLKPISLNLKYGVGNAFADLSGLSVEKLKINTGSADVIVGYQEGKPNTIKMDTFYVKVDLGSVTAKRVNLSNASNIIADVGFGDLSLEFTELVEEEINVNASVGAGTLQVIFTDPTIPTIIRVNNSMLCKIKLNEHFREIEDNVYVNESYHHNARNLMTFNLDVAMGNIIFKNQ